MAASGARPEILGLAYAWAATVSFASTYASIKVTIDNRQHSCYKWLCYRRSQPETFTRQIRGGLSHFARRNPITPFPFSHLQTLFRNGANLSPFLTIACTLFCP